VGVTHEQVEQARKTIRKSLAQQPGRNYRDARKRNAYRVLAWALSVLEDLGRLPEEPQ
jgi:hypothetical protein